MAANALLGAQQGLPSILNVPPVESSDITMEQIIGGLWQMPQNGKKVLFVINVSQEKAKCTVECEIGKSDLELEPMQVYVKEF